MKPAYSVIFLTTLIGVGQGLFIALYGAELLGFADAAPGAHMLLAVGGGVALVFSALGSVGVVLPPRSTRAGLALGGDVAHLVAVARSDRAPAVHGRRLLLGPGHAMGATWTDRWAR